MDKKTKNSGIIAGVFFPIVILLMFVILSLMLALYSGNIYKSLRNSTDESFQMMSAENYIQTRIFQNNRVGAFSLSTQNNIQILTIQIPTEQDSFESRIFCYDGYLMEHFTTSSSPLNIEEATKIAPIESCTFTLYNNTFFMIELSGKGDLYSRIPINIVAGGMI